MKNVKKWLILSICVLATTSLFGQQAVDWANFERYAEQNKTDKNTFESRVYRKFDYRRLVVCRFVVL